MSSVEEEARTLRTPGAFGLMFFLLAQIFQEIARRAMPAPLDETAAFLAELHPLQRARSALVLLSFFGLYAGFLAIGLARVRRRPGTIALALSFLGLFCAVEILYRSVDFFAVEGAWLRRYAAAADPAQRALMRSHVEAFRDVIRALYAPLMLSQMFGSALAAAAFFPAQGADRWVVAGFGFNAVRLVGRFAASYLGLGWLGVLGGELYFPTVILSYGPMLAWAMSSTRPREP
ncbi:MAG TPA: hypothetical protein VFS43_31520 [Polyangiaceae bacterium]|nr:hypothetical protein [Polyangiaceae bacterium]